MDSKLKDLSLLEVSRFVKVSDSGEASDNETFDVMGKSQCTRVKRLSININHRERKREERLT